VKTLSYPRLRAASKTAVLLGLALATPAFAADATALPRPIVGKTVIDRPGVYVLVRGFALTEPGTAIRITASNVTLDLAGATLTGPGEKQGIGIQVDGATGIRIHGGMVSGFGTGVEVRGATNVRVEDLQIEGLDLGGPPPGEVGVLILNSRAVVIEHNVVSHTFLGVFVRGGGSGGNRIANNTITGGTNGQLAICYNPDGLGTLDGPSGDLVYNNHVSRFNLGIQTSAGTASNIFRENSIVFFQQDVNEVAPGQNVFEGNTSIAAVP
jgi:nitrous oxidase accessory protein NosD